jgi:acyl-CoA synthetase (AMP-forming)/AMP-acid ligase II
VHPDNIVRFWLSHGDRVALGDPDGRHWTFAEIGRRAARVAHTWRNLGVHRRDAVWIWSRPSELHAILAVGTIGFGAVAGILPDGAPPPAVRAALEASAARLLVTDSRRKAAVDSWRRALPELWHVVLADDGPAPMSGGDFRLRDYIEPAAEAFDWPPLGGAWPAVYLGDAAGVLSHAELAATSAAIPFRAWDDPRLVCDVLAPAWRTGLSVAAPLFRAA